MHDMSGQGSTIISEELRNEFANDKALGSGNYVHVAAAKNPARNEELLWLDRPCRTFTEESFTSFSLLTFKRVVDQYAAWYYTMGVKEKDPVAGYFAEGVENLIHFAALTSIGALPILVNGNMRPETAAAFIKKAGAIALYSDLAHREALAPFLDTADFKFDVVDEIARDELKGKLLSLPKAYPHQHHATDAVLIGHSSGTTGIPKAVVFQHESFFYGIRYRLSLPAPKGGERTLSALPHSHSAGVAYLMLALLSGNKTMVLSNPLADGVLPQVDRFRPTMVVAFPQTYVDLAEADLSNHDLSSIQIWVNGGDAAHEAHIRKLVNEGTHWEGEKQVKGSIFIDGLGSSEMGFSLFRNVHTKNTEHYHRCIGAPLDWVQAVALDETGNELPPFQIGKLGVKAASVTSGYWNDSLLSIRAQVKGFWLTGDMVYRDEANRFYHVDRVPDVIRTQEGTFYSLQAEELLLRHCPDLLDVTIVGVPVKAGRDSEYQVPVAVVRPTTKSTLNTESLGGRLNEILAAEGKQTLQAVLSADSRKFPLGPTGKVLKRELREALADLFA